MPRTARKKDASQHLGLVCLSFGDECRFRTITRTRFLALSAEQRRPTLDELYRSNLQRLNGALHFCDRLGIRLYRATSSLFPMSDEPLGEQVLRGLSSELASIGPLAQRLGIRVVLHPDQFVVLNSDSPAVAATSVKIMKKHALAFDLMHLPRSSWSAMILHGGKSGRADVLVERIGKLPENVRSRLCLENDEYAYSASEILDVCRRAGVPMVFDNLHHAVKQKLVSYDDPSVARFVRAARDTWPRPDWQIVHLSNGKANFLDRNHSDFITDVPPAYRGLPWVEVEARAKERAILKLREDHGLGVSVAPQRETA